MFHFSLDASVAQKMMSELRFQCFEVEKMHRARNGLIKSNTHLLAQAASVRHRVEELARRSHLLQRIVRYMHQKVDTALHSVNIHPSLPFDHALTCSDGEC